MSYTSYNGELHLDCEQVEFLLLAGDKHSSCVADDEIMEETVQPLLDLGLVEQHGILFKPTRRGQQVIWAIVDEREAADAENDWDYRPSGPEFASENTLSKRIQGI